MDDFLHYYSIRNEIQEIYELFYIIISDLTKNSPDRMMLRLGEGENYARFNSANNASCRI